MGKESRHWSRSISTRDRDITASGCMGGMLHYFDFHHILFNGGHGCNRMAPSSVNHSDLRNLKNSTKGLEAPRNSLEGEITEQAKTSSSSVVEDQYFEIPVGVQLAPAYDVLPAKIRRHSRKLSLLGDEEDRRVPDTPETPRTPSLVARLMGIDGLPDPAPSPPATARQKKLSESTKNELKKRELRSSKLQECKKEPRQPLRNINCNARFSDVGCRSLPDTPRVSSARSSWDVDARHSLQIHRENLNSCHSNVPGGEYSLPPSPTHYSMKPRKKYQDENRSPRSREYAKEIVKQMKETISNRRESGREDTNVKSKRSSAREVQKHDRGSRTKPALVSVSPPSPQPVSASPSKTTEHSTKAKLQDHIPNLHVLPKPVRVKPSRPPPPPPVPAGGTGKCNKATNERFTARFKKPASPTSGSLATVTGDKTCSIVIEKSEITPKLFRSPQLKKDDSTSLAQPKIPKSCRTRPDEDLEYKYVRSILHRGGFMGPSQAAKRYSPSLPVDPIVFHQLEVELPVDDSRYRGSTLRYRWNRKHLFHLVEELLTDLLDCTGRTNHPVHHDEYITDKNSYNLVISGTHLLRKVWSEIERIPSADCQYLTDIDALVAIDMPVTNIRELTRHRAVVNQASDIAVQMEQEILDELIGETASYLSLSSHCL